MHCSRVPPDLRQSHTRGFYEAHVAFGSSFRVERLASCAPVASHISGFPVGTRCAKTAFAYLAARHRRILASTISIAVFSANWTQNTRACASTHLQLAQAFSAWMAAACEEYSSLLFCSYWKIGSGSRCRCCGTSRSFSGRVQVGLWPLYGGEVC